jgi:hypothetical protein
LIDPLNADAEKKKPLLAVVCHSAEQAVTHVIPYVIKDPILDLIPISYHLYYYSPDKYWAL